MTPSFLAPIPAILSGTCIVEPPQCQNTNLYCFIGCHTAKYELYNFLRDLCNNQSHSKIDICFQASKQVKYKVNINEHYFVN